MIDQTGPGGEARSRAASTPIIRVVELARHAAIVGIAGVVTGVVVGGLGGRVMMRISAIAAPDYAMGASTEGGNVVGEITVDGTLALILFVGVLSGLVGAVAYLISEPWLRWSGRWQGPVFGVLLLAIGSAGALDPGNQDFLILGNPELNVAMLVVLFVSFGVLIVPLVQRLTRLLPAVDPSRPLAGSWAYLAMAALGLQFLGAFFLQFFDAEAGGAETAPVEIGFVLLGLTVVTLLYRVRQVRGEGRAEAGPPSYVGHGLLLAATLLGATRAISDISDISEILAL